MGALLLSPSPPINHNQSLYRRSGGCIYHDPAPATLPFSSLLYLPHIGLIWLAQMLGISYLKNAHFNLLRCVFSLL